MAIKPEEIKLTQAQAEALKSRISEASGLSEEDKKLISGLISFNFWLRSQLSKASFTLKKLKSFLGFKTEKRNRNDNASKGAETTEDESSEPSDKIDKEASSETDDRVKKKPRWNEAANHGRYGFEDYSGLETVVHSHETLKTGDLCPECQAHEQAGKLSAYDAGHYIRLEGQPIIGGTRHKLSGLRCQLCSSIFKPELPEKIKNTPKFSPKARSQLAIAHYYYGLPFNRIEDWQKNSGIPVPSSTQYDQMSILFKQIYPVVQCFQELSANSGMTYYDDTGNKLLDDIKSPAHSTAIVSQYQQYWIYLFCTNFEVASKEVNRLLKQRDTEETLILMSDASSQNSLSDLEEKLVSRMIIAYCLVHGRRKFFDLQSDFPHECQIVIDCIAEVYRHEAYCKHNQLCAHERLVYHQQHSGPLLEALYLYLNNLWLYDRVEKNSPLGQAVRYLLKYWRFLTRFLWVENCPLDNSLCERAIKVLIRYRKNSLFYKTLVGARCGDTLMSLIHTAVQNKVDAHDYLTALQWHADEVAKNPALFLPWTYQATLAGHNDKLVA